MRDAADLLADGSSETAKVRRLSKENRTLRQRLKELELEAAVIDSSRDFHLARVRYEAAIGIHAPATSGSK